MTPSFIWALAIAVIFCWMIFRFRRQTKSENLSSAFKAILPMPNNEGLLAGVGSRPKRIYRKQKSRPVLSEPPEAPKPIFTGKHYSRETLEHLLSMGAILGDFSMILAGFMGGIYLCRSHFIPAAWQSFPTPPLMDSLNVIFSGSLIILWGLTGKELYVYKSLLAPSRTWHKLVEPLGLYLAAFIGISQILRIDPQFPWIYFVVAILCIFAGLFGWRVALGLILKHPALSSRLRRRLVVIGGGSQTKRIQKAVSENTDMEFVGWVQAIKPNHIPELEEYRLGSIHELAAILHVNAINIAVLTESESLQREGVLAVAKACEAEHVHFKMVPHFFEILISSLRSEEIAGIQLLGVGALPLGGFRNQVLKRGIDILGASVGLLLAAPLIAIFGLLVYLESPGPILYKQLRQGRSGRLFYIVKIRSMHVNAEAGGKAQWAQQNDQRRLRIGTFLRKWNIDEVPQFWNVLVGQMSLVGPRPERPELIARFKSKIPHYQSRHMCQPGITGWAQVNGWRGNTDLEERIRHDIWYLENWNIWLDFRIMAMTFTNRKNAY